MVNAGSRFDSRRFLKQVASPLLDKFGLFDGAVQQVLTAQGAWTMVMYHRVIDNRLKDPFGLGMCVHRTHFEDQLAYFRRFFTPLSVREGVAMLARGQALPARALSITFDDGYEDNLTQAAPLLARYDMPWSLFVTTGGMDQNEPFWWDRVIRCFALTSRDKLEAQDLDLPDLRQPLSLESGQRKASLDRILQVLWNSPIDKTLSVITRLEALLLTASHARRGPFSPRLNRAQLQQLAHAGVEIEAHTVRHPNMSLLSDAQLRQELTEARSTLEQATGYPVLGFAYPGGRTDGNVADAVQACGYDFAAGTRSGINLAPYQTFDFVRVGMPDTGVADFKRALGKAVRRSFSAPDAPPTTTHSPMY